MQGTALFETRKRFPYGLVTGLIIIALIFVGIWVWARPPRINISRVQYEWALAKWQAQKVEQYEITTDTKSFGGGVMTLRVSDHGNKIEVLAPKARASSTLTDEGIEFYRPNTVEGLFENVDARLRENEVFSTGGRVETGGFYMAYQVSFHPRYGYPNHIEGRPITEPGVHVFDADWETTVTNFKILKQGN
jgi:hypothetical protein